MYCRVKRSRSSFRLAALILVISAVGVFFVQPARAERQFLQGHVPAAVPKLKPLRDLPGSKRLNLIIGLPLRNRGNLAAFLNQLYDPASPNFHQYLTATGFADRFGPTEQDYKVAIEFARSNNLVVTALHSNRTLLGISGAVADIEKAFHVHMRAYQHPVEKREFYAPDIEPSMDIATPVLGITGLDNYVKPHPQSRINTIDPKAAPRSGSGSFGTYLGGDFRAAYVPGTALTGAGQSIGLFELDGYYASDISSYESLASLPSVTLTNVLVDGYNGQIGNGSIEVSLDIEMAIAMAPGLSSVIVYEGPNVDDITAPNDVLNRMATDNAAKQLSCSWGFSINSLTEQIFQQYAAQGQSFFLASGDTGAYTSSISPPSDDPHVTVVGGTTLSTSGAGGAWTSEKVWNWYNSGQGNGASSGGISTTYQIPGWQQPVSMAANQGSATKRNLPDVALTADNVWTTYSNGLSGSVGGTSCAAPLWAGLLALANQQGTSNGLPPVGFVNPAVYAIGLSGEYSSAFHDIVTGNNTSPSSPNEFFAVPGYDLCTGWGTPAGTNLINLLLGAPLISGQASLLSESCLPTNGVIDPGETVTINLTLTNLFAMPTSNLVATLLQSGNILGPGAPQTYGVVAAGAPPVVEPFTFTAGGACGDVISAVWQLQDGATSLGTVQVNFALGQPITTNVFSENFDIVIAPDFPAGWTSSASDTEAPWVTIATAADTRPNSAFAADLTTSGIAYLVSPPISILTSNAQLTFRQNYRLESITTTHRHSPNTTTYYDGGVLEIQIGPAGFSDIISAGGRFVTGGYVGSLYSSAGNPLGGRQGWSGNSDGWITTTVNLPPTAAGQIIQLRWDLATDSGNAATVTGWYIDGVSVQDGYYTCCNDNGLLPATLNAAGINVTGGGFSISVPTVAGVNYGLEYKDNLMDPAWTLLPLSVITGTGGTVTLQDNTPAQTARFYRVVSN